MFTWFFKVCIQLRQRLSFSFPYEQCVNKSLWFIVLAMSFIWLDVLHTWPKLHINQTQKTNILHPQNRIKSRKGLRHIPSLIMYSFFTYDVQSFISIHSFCIPYKKKGVKTLVSMIIMCIELQCITYANQHFIPT